MLSTSKIGLYLLLFLQIINFASKAQNKVKTNPVIILDSSKRAIILPGVAQGKINSLNDENKRYWAAGDKLELKVNTDKSVYIDFSSGHDLRTIYIGLCKVDTLKISGNGKTRLVIDGAKQTTLANTANVLDLKGCIIENLNIPETRMNCLTIDASAIKYLNIKNGAIVSTFTIRSSSVDSTDFYHAYLPEFIFLDRVNLTKIGSLNFNDLVNLSNTKEEPALELERTIKLREIDFDRIKLAYDRFSFHVDSLQCHQHRIWIYQKILKHISEEGMTEQYVRYNTDFTELRDGINRQYFTNWISKMWWNKGRNKTRVVYWCIGSFSFFLFFNFFFVKLLPLVYYPQNFDEYFYGKNQMYLEGCSSTSSVTRLKSKFLLFWFKLWGIIWYTTFIFWGLKLNLDALKFKSLWLVMYIILQYAVGLIFVAYIVSFVIIRL